MFQDLSVSRSSFREISPASQTTARISIEVPVVTFDDLKEHIYQAERRLCDALAEQVAACERRLRAELLAARVEDRPLPVQPRSIAEPEVNCLVAACANHTGRRRISHDELRAVLETLLPGFSEGQVDVLVDEIQQNALLAGKDGGVDWQHLVKWLVGNDKSEDPATPKQAKEAVSPSGDAAEQHDTTQKPPSAYQRAFEAAGGQGALDEAKDITRHQQLKAVDEELEQEIWELLPTDLQYRKGYSSRLLNQRFVADLDTLLGEADAVLEGFHAKVREQAKATGGTEILVPRKDRARAEMKAVFKYPDTNGGVAYYRLTDLVRATISYRDIPSMYSGLQAVIDSYGNAVKEINDRYRSPLPDGYRDLQLVVEHDGHLCELVLNTDSMVRAKEESGPRIFDLHRELEAAILDGDLRRCNQALQWVKSQSGMGDMPFLREEDGPPWLMHEAARRGHAEIIQVLMQNGASSNTQDEDGNTPLHLAMQGAHHRAVWILLAEGAADFKILNKKKQPALLCGYIRLRQHLEGWPQEQAVRTVCMLAQWAGAAHIAEVRKQIEEDLKVQLRWCPHLVLLARNGRAAEVRRQLQDMADPNSRDDTGRPALVAASVGGHVEVVELLLNFRATPTVSDRQRHSALDAAFRSRNAQVTSLLMAAGAEPRAVVADLVETGQSGFVHIGAAADGRLYCAPWDNSSVMIYDPTTQRASFVDTGVNGTAKWAGAAAVGDGRMYFGPHTQSSVLVLDPETQTLKMVATGTSLERGWDGITCGLDGRIYCSPLQSSSVLILDPVTEQVRFVETGVEGDHRWVGITMADDGRLYCAPYSCASVLILNPATDEIRLIDTGMIGESKWAGIVQAPNGYLYCAPCNSSDILVVDPVSETVKFVDVGVFGSAKWAGITVGPDGRLYCAPVQSSAVLVFDPASEEMEFLDTWEDAGFRGIAKGSDGHLYCAPLRSTSILRLQDMRNALHALGL